MDEKSKAILAGFSGRKKLSQLAPHRDLISKLHQRGCAFREIVRILAENFSLMVAPSTVCRFVAGQEKEESKPRKTKPQKEKPVPITPTAPAIPVAPKRPAPVGSFDEARQRIAVLKQRPVHTEPNTKLFEYDPDQPLHLVPETEKTKGI
jgi:IS30 family transposase